MRVLVGFDGSPPSRRALAHAGLRASSAQDELVAVTVLPRGVVDKSLATMMPAGVVLHPEFGGTFGERAQAQLEAAVAELVPKTVAAKIEVREGDGADGLIAACKSIGAELVVIGQKSYQGEGSFLGPVADRLVREMPVPVTVVR